MKNKVLFILGILSISILFQGCGNKNKTEAAEFFERGNYHFKKREYDRAIELFSEAIEKVPDFADAFNNRGLCFEKQGNLEKAAGDYQKAVELDDSFSQAKLNLAAANVHLGKLEESQSLFKNLESIYADSSQFYDYRGQYFLQKYDPDRAIVDFEKAIALNKENAETLTNLGYAYYQKRDFETAQKTFEKALALEPNFAFALNNISATLAQKNKWNDALAYSTKLVKENPGNTNFLNTHVLNLLENNQLSEAKTYLESSLKLSPENAYTLRNAAILELKTENKVKAFNMLQKIEDSNPEVEYLYYYLGLSAENKGETCEYFTRGAKLLDVRCVQALKVCK